MALINCPECDREVSDKAPTCPGCGVPIAAQFAETEPTDNTPPQQPQADPVTTEEVDEEWLRGEQEYLAFTDRIQIQRILSVLLFFGGLTLGMGMKAWMGDDVVGRPLVYTVADWMVYLGIVWLVVNELRNLWYHRKFSA